MIDPIKDSFTQTLSIKEILSKFLRMILAESCPYQRWRIINGMLQSKVNPSTSGTKWILHPTKFAHHAFFLFHQFRMKTNRWQFFLNVSKQNKSVESPGCSNVRFPILCYELYYFSHDHKTIGFRKLDLKWMELSFWTIW